MGPTHTTGLPKAFPFAFPVEFPCAASRSQKSRSAAIVEDPSRKSGGLGSRTAPPGSQKKVTGRRVFSGPSKALYCMRRTHRRPPCRFHHASDDVAATAQSVRPPTGLYDAHQVVVHPVTAVGGGVISQPDRPQAETRHPSLPRPTVVVRRADLRTPVTAAAGSAARSSRGACQGGAVGDNGSTAAAAAVNGVRATAPRYHPPSPHHPTKPHATAPNHPPHPTLNQPAPTATTDPPPAAPPLPPRPTNPTPILGHTFVGSPPGNLRRPVRLAER
jgi:hypothetical protein